MTAGPRQPRGQLECRLLVIRRNHKTGEISLDLYMGRNAEAAPSLQLLWRHLPDHALVGPEGLFGHIHVEFAELGCMCDITFEGRLRILTLHFKRFIKRLHAE